MGEGSKIIGLDLGIASIGWACVQEYDDETKNKIIHSGVRIVPFNDSEGNDFSQGKSITINATRRQARSMRRNVMRFKLRRHKLIHIFTKINFIEKENLKKLIHFDKKENPLKLLELRAKAIKEQISKEEFVSVLLKINKKRGYKSNRKANQTDQTTEEAKPIIKKTKNLQAEKETKEVKKGLVEQISERSLSLEKNNQTVGENQLLHLKNDALFSTAEQAFYRKEYEEEFEKIWNKQAEFYSELNQDLKVKVKAKTIFAQRLLKSQKGLLGFCELESQELELIIDKKPKLIRKGSKVIAKSSPLFQEFKIWDKLHSLRIKNKEDNSETKPSIEKLTELFEQLNYTEKISKTEVLKWLFRNSSESYKNYELKEDLQGNKTNAKFIKAYKAIIAEEFEIDYKKLTIKQELQIIGEHLEKMGIDKTVLEFDAMLEHEKFDKQKSYLLWHLLYSYQGDNSKTGLDSLYKKLYTNFGFKTPYSKIIAEINFKDDYGNLSAKAIRKILPYLKKGNDFTEAKNSAGYTSSSLTKEENEKRKLDKELIILKKNSLRNPVVEKILNQMIWVVNTITETEENGGKNFQPTKIRVELARELKNTADQRKKMTKAIRDSTTRHENLKEELMDITGLPYVSRNDLIRYKLYLELKPNNYHTLYSNKEINLKELFTTNKYDIEHIIPKAKLYDDSFSNKTLELHSVNQKKGDAAKNLTAFDFIEQEYGQKAVEEYKARVEQCFKDQDGIGYTKKERLLTSEEDIPKDFLNRDLGETAYISKKAVEILEKICKNVTVTSGSITARLREDWKLNEVLRELNWEKYKNLDLTEYKENRHGQQIPKITDWSKRNDHRHHAVDAIIVAFTKPAYIQYLNNLNAKSNKDSIFYAIEQKYLKKDEEKKNGKKCFVPPINDMRKEVREQLEQILVSHKDKNKVLTKNINKTKTKNGIHKQTVDTPRGQLHKETIYKKIYIPSITEERINASFDTEKIATLCNSIYKKALEKRLKEFENDPQKAFMGKNILSKNPILLENGEEVPQKVQLRTQEMKYTKRESIPSNVNATQFEKFLVNVVDEGIKIILQKRLEEYGGNPKNAFSNLEQYPIWLNPNPKEGERKIPIKKVRVLTTIKTAIPMRYKKNHFGEPILDEEGHKIPTDFVDTGSNHAALIFQKSDGSIEDEMITFLDIVRLKGKLDDLLEEKTKEGYQYLFSLKKNEFFVFPSLDFNPKEIDLKDPKYKKIISKNLYRVQSISKKHHTFRHHLETKLVDKIQLKNVVWKSIRSVENFKHLTSAVKIRLNHLGDIVEIGESKKE